MVGHRNHQRIAQAVPVLPGRLDQRLNLILRDVLVTFAAVLGVSLAAGVRNNFRLFS